MYSRDYSKYSAIDWRDDMSSQIWNFDSNDSNILVDDMIRKLQSCADRHAPVKKLNVKEIKLKSKPWITNDILKLIKMRDKLFARKKRQPNNDNVRRLYNLFRNRVIRELRKSKKAYFTTYFEEHSNNIRKTWDGIRKLVNLKGKSQELSQLDINGSSTND